MRQLLDKHGMDITWLFSLLLPDFELLTVCISRRFFTAESVKFNIHIGDYHNWRSHVKLAVAPMSRWGGLKIGLFKSGSHDVEPINACRVHHPRINEVNTSAVM